MIKNFTKQTIDPNRFTKDYEPYFCGVCGYKADIFIGDKVSRNTDKHFIENNQKKRSYLKLFHTTGLPVSQLDENGGLTITVFEKKFSEKTGTNWEKTHFAYCEPQ